MNGWLPDNVFVRPDVVTRLICETGIGRSRPLSQEDLNLEFGAPDQSTISHMKTHGDRKGSPFSYTHTVCRFASALSAALCKEIAPMSLVDIRRTAEREGRDYKLQEELFNSVTSDLADASSASTLDKRKALLRSFLGAYTSYERDYHSIVAVPLFRVREELSNLEPDPRENRVLRQDNIAAFLKIYNLEPNIYYLLTFSRHVVHLFLQNFTDEALRGHIVDLIPFLNSACDEIDEGRDPGLMAVLLARKATVLYCHALLDESLRFRKKRRGEAIRAAKKAVTLAPSNSIAHIALGQAYWRNEQYAQAEEELLSASSYVLGSLALSRFYRARHRYQECVQAFEAYDDRERDRPRLLRHAYILGEAAWGLAFNENRSDYLEYAAGCLHGALDYGYRNFRTIVALAKIEAERFSQEAGRDVLCQASLEDIGWDDMLSKVMRFAKERDFTALESAFVVGLDTGMAWNAMGSFVYDYVHHTDRIEMAETIYDLAESLSPGYPVILYNKARIALEKRESTEFHYLLSKAAGNAPPELRKFISELASKARTVFEQT